MSTDTLEVVRAEIDRLDGKLVALLVEREALVRRAGGLKTSDAEVPAPDRARRVVEQARRRAAEAGGDPDVAGAVWSAMIEAFVALELRSRHSPS